MKHPVATRLNPSPAGGCSDPTAHAPPAGDQNIHPLRRAQQGLDKLIRMPVVLRLPQRMVRSGNPRKLMNVKFNASQEDRDLALAIALRFQEMQRAAGGVPSDLLDIEMDIIATHCNGNPLRLDELATADDFNLAHDVGGISRHLDRSTGKLTNFFSPRFSGRKVPA